MPSVYLRLNISTTECLEFYNSQASNVKAYTVDGRSVVFPRRILKSLVGHDGIRGLYRMTYSDTGQFISIERVANWFYGKAIKNPRLITSLGLVSTACFLE